MLIEIYPRYEFRLPLTLEEVTIIEKIAQHHYDSACRATATEKGILGQWKQTLELAKEYNWPDEKVRANFSDLDLITKVLESCNRSVLHDKEKEEIAASLYHSFWSILGRANDLYRQHKNENKHEYETSNAIRW
jgi:hypothetical protein